MSNRRPESFSDHFRNFLRVLFLNFCSAPTKASRRSAALRLDQRKCVWGLDRVVLPTPGGSCGSAGGGDVESGPTRPQASSPGGRNGTSAWTTCAPTTNWSSRACRGWPDRCAKRVVVDEGPLLGQVPDDTAGRAGDLPHRSHRSRHEDQEHPSAHGVLSEVLLGDLVLALTAPYSR